MFLSHTGFQVFVSGDRRRMGELAAGHAAARARELLNMRSTINMVFAAAPSQVDFIESFLCAGEGIFERIRAFHMDEYVGLPVNAPQGFANFLRAKLFSRAPFLEVNTLSSRENPETECQRYEALLRAYPPDIIIMGIGENGHIAFNDPHEADFDDARYVKTVTLDEVCRRQQVNDGCFENLADVPTRAITLTVSLFRAAKSLFCVVPTARKAEAVARAVLGEVSEACPATALRLCEDARLYLDADSAVNLYRAPGKAAL